MAAEPLEPRLLLTHFRFGTIAWEPDLASDASGQTIDFTIEQAYRWSYFGYPSVGNAVHVRGGDDALFLFGDGSSSSLQLEVIAVDETEDWFHGRTTITHTYSGTGEFTASFELAERISELQSNRDLGARTETLVDVGAHHASPVTSIPMMLAVPDNRFFQFQIPASDPDGDPLTYRLATVLEATYGTYVGSYVHPPGLDVSSSGLLTWDLSDSALATTPGDLWTTQVIVSDGRATVPLDFILRITTEDDPLAVPAHLRQIKQLDPIAFNGPGEDIDIEIRNLFPGLDPDQTVEVWAGLTIGGLRLLGVHQNPAGLPNWSISVNLADAGFQMAEWVAVVSDRPLSIVEATPRWTSLDDLVGYPQRPLDEVTDFPSPSTARNVAEVYKWGWQEDTERWKYTSVPNLETLSDDDPNFWNRQTIILTHGWNDQLGEGDPDEYMEVFAKHFSQQSERYNILAVDWYDDGSPLGSDPNSNSSLLDGLNIADAIKSATNGIAAAVPFASTLVDAGLTDPSNVMLVGHSNGAGFMASLAAQLKKWTGKVVAELVALDAPWATPSWWKVQEYSWAAKHITNYYIPRVATGGFGWPMFAPNVTNVDLFEAWCRASLLLKGHVQVLAHSVVPLYWAYQARRFHDSFLLPSASPQFAPLNLNTIPLIGSEGFDLPEGESLRDGRLWIQDQETGLLIRQPDPVTLTANLLQHTLDPPGTSPADATDSIWNFADPQQPARGANSYLVAPLAASLSESTMLRLLPQSAGALAAIDLAIPDDVALFSFELTVLNAGNDDALWVVIDDEAIIEIDLHVAHESGTSRFELWVGDYSGHDVTLSFYIPSDEPSTADVLVGNLEFGLITNLHQPPVVSQVLASSSAWSEQFLAALEAAGLGTGGVRLDLAGPASPILPWSNVDQITFRFNKRLHLPEDALAVRGTVKRHEADSQYGPATFTASLSMLSSIRADNLLLDLGPASEIVDIAGHALAGVVQYPFSALIGDVDGSGAVTATDVTYVAGKVGLAVGDTGFDIRADLDGDGLITMADANLVATKVGSHLPPGTPTTPPTIAYTNLVFPQDVNDDGVVTPHDALIVINELLRLGSHTLPPVTPGAQLPSPYRDVSGDGRMSPLDALRVINHLLARSQPIVPATAPAARTAAEVPSEQDAGPEEVPAMNAVALALTVDVAGEQALPFVSQPPVNEFSQPSDAPVLSWLRPEIHSAAIGQFVAEVDENDESLEIDVDLLQDLAFLCTKNKDSQVFPPHLGI